MLIYINNQVMDYREAFKNTSFPPSGPSDEFLGENGAVRVSVFKEHDRATEKLIPAEPYIENGFAYTVQVAAKTEAEIAAEEAARLAKVDRARFDAYTKEADPLYFKWKRGESTEQAWLDKIAEIKTRYPKEVAAPA